MNGYEFPPLCPDFVIELRSRTDTLEKLKNKMQEYLSNGAQLGWLIDPQERRVYIYQSETDFTCLEDPKMVSGDPILPGFVLEVTRLW